MTYEELAQLIFPEISVSIDDLEKKYPPRNLPIGAEVTRFAPSPTGFLHTGSLFTSMICHKLAKQTNANFYDQVAEYNEYQDETFYYTREVEGLTEKELTIDSIPAGGTVTVSYEFAITKVEDENSVTSGSITISGDSLVEKTIDTYLRSKVYFYHSHSIANR